MLSTSILKWPCLTVALFVAGMLCLSSPGWAGLLLSRGGDAETAGLSRLELEKEIITGSLLRLGWSREEATERLAQLPDGEIHRIAAALDRVRAGGEEENPDSRALGVGLVIVIVLAAITGLYLFANSN
ncbi:MAG: hypothetical protein V1789_08180 [PVC group bacterium]